jgi:hypothetical protein
MNCKIIGCVQPKSSSAWHTGLSGGAPDSVRCARLVSGENAALGIRRWRTAIIHRTVRWCTGLSGESSAANSSLSGNRKGDMAIIHRTVRWCTGLSGEPTVASANGRPRTLRATRGSSNGRGGTGLSGVHQTVSIAPMGPELQRSSVPDLEGNRAPDRLQDLSGGTPDCPVCHSTECKDDLPSLSSTAPSCLGAIKGTPRRMEEQPQAFTKHPKTPRLQLHAFDSLC